MSILEEKSPALFRLLQRTLSSEEMNACLAVFSKPAVSGGLVDELLLLRKTTEVSFNPQWARVIQLFLELPKQDKPLLGIEAILGLFGKMKASRHPGRSEEFEVLVAELPPRAQLAFLLDRVRHLHQEMLSFKEKQALLEKLQGQLADLNTKDDPLLQGKLSFAIRQQQRLLSASEK